MSQRLYDKSPYFIQQILLNLYSLKIHKERYGKKFRQVYNELLESQYFSVDEIKNYQTEHFIKIVKHAYSTVPYYRKLFDSISLKPSDIKCLEDSHKIPVLTKQLVRENYDDLISTKFNKRDLVQGGTSGTTGSPLRVLWDKNACIYTNAVDWRQKLWAGVTYGDRIAQLLGRTIISTKRRKKPFWQMDYLHKQLWMSSFHLSDETIRDYVDKLNVYKPIAIEGYPSTLYILADYLNKNNCTVSISAALSSSETLLPFQREAIKKAFNCDLFDFYGLAERVVFATECEYHDGKHLNFEYGYTEIINDNDENVPDGKKGYLVSTGLQNYGMPLIRYKTSDITSVQVKPCQCGRHMPKINDITTKAEDIIVTPDGKMISASVLTHPFKMVHGVRKSQIIQEDLKNITIKLVIDQQYNSEEETALLENLQRRMGLGVNLNVRLVDEIERTSSGKYRWVISNVPKGKLSQSIE